MENKKKLLVISWCYPPRAGGPATEMTILAEKFALERKLKVKFLVPFPRDEGKGEIIGVKTNFKFFPLKIVEFITKALLHFAGRKEEIQFIQAHDFSVSTVLAVLLNSLFYSKARIISVFTGDPIFELINYYRKRCPDYEYFRKGESILYNFLFQLYRRFIVNKLYLVILPHQWLVQDVKRFQENINYRVITPSFPHSLFHSGRIKKEKVILVVSRMVPWKNVEKAIELFLSVKKKGWKMWVVGEGPLLPFYLQKYGSRKEIEFRTRISYPELVTLYQKAYIFLLLSGYETYSISISEALEAGCIPLVSDIPIFRERFKNGEVLFMDLHSFSQMKRRLREVMEAYPAKIVGKKDRSKEKEMGAEDYFSLYSSISP